VRFRLSTIQLAFGDSAALIDIISLVEKTDLLKEFFETVFESKRVAIIGNVLSEIICISCYLEHDG
jgi:hypothetical protein